MRKQTNRPIVIGVSLLPAFKKSYEYLMHICATWFKKIPIQQSLIHRVAVIRRHCEKFDQSVMTQDSAKCIVAREYWGRMKVVLHVIVTL